MAIKPAKEKKKITKVIKPANEKKAAAESAAPYHFTQGMRNALIEFDEEDDDVQHLDLDLFCDIKSFTIITSATQLETPKNPSSSETSPPSPDTASPNKDSDVRGENKEGITGGEEGEEVEEGIKGSEAKDGEAIKAKDANISGLRRLTHRSQYGGFISKRVSEARQISSDIHKAIILSEGVRKRRREPAMRHYRSKPSLVEAGQGSAAALANSTLVKNSTLSSLTESKAENLASQRSQSTYKKQLTEADQSFISALTDSSLSEISAPSSPVTTLAEIPSSSLLITSLSAKTPKTLTTTYSEASTPPSIPINMTTEASTPSTLTSAKAITPSIESSKAEIEVPTSSSTPPPPPIMNAKNKETMAAKQVKAYKDAKRSSQSAKIVRIFLNQLTSISRLVAANAKRRTSPHGPMKSQRISMQQTSYLKGCGETAKQHQHYQVARSSMAFRIASLSTSCTAYRS